MTKYLINWNSGFGDNHEVVEAGSEEAAEQIAYDMAREDFESSVSFGAEPLTKDNAEDYGFEDELDETA